MNDEITLKSAVDDFVAKGLHTIFKIVLYHGFNNHLFYRLSHFHHFKLFQ